MALGLGAPKADQPGGHPPTNFPCLPMGREGSYYLITLESNGCGLAEGCKAAKIGKLVICWATSSPLPSWQVVLLHCLWRRSPDGGRARFVAKAVSIPN